MADHDAKAMPLTLSAAEMLDRCADWLARTDEPHWSESADDLIRNGRNLARQLREGDAPAPAGAGAPDGDVQCMWTGCEAPAVVVIVSSHSPSSSRCDRHRDTIRYPLDAPAPSPAAADGASFEALVDEFAGATIAATADDLYLQTLEYKMRARSRELAARAALLAAHAEAVAAAEALADHAATAAYKVARLAAPSAPIDTSTWIADDNGLVNGGPATDELDR